MHKNLSTFSSNTGDILVFSELINNPRTKSKITYTRANSDLIEQLQDRLRAKSFRLQEKGSIKLAYIQTCI